MSRSPLRGCRCDWKRRALTVGFWQQSSGRFDERALGQKLLKRLFPVALIVPMRASGAEPDLVSPQRDFIVGRHREFRLRARYRGDGLGGSSAHAADVSAERVKSDDIVAVGNVARESRDARGFELATKYTGVRGCGHGSLLFRVKGTGEERLAADDDRTDCLSTCSEVDAEVNSR